MEVVCGYVLVYSQSLYLFAQYLNVSEDYRNAEIEMLANTLLPWTSIMDMKDLTIYLSITINNFFPRYALIENDWEALVYCIS